MLERRLSRRAVLRYGGIAGAGLISTSLLAACGDDDDDDDAGQAATATDEPMMDETPTEEMMMDPTATEAPMMEETPTEEMMAEETPTEEMMMEPTATEEMMAEPTPTEEMMAEETPTEEMMGDMVLPLISGWYRGEEVQYYDFGMNTPLTMGNEVATAPIWVLIHERMMDDEDPQFVEGQHNIVDVVPGDEGYSDLWQVMLVEVPDDYEPDSIRNAADINEMAYPVTATEMYVNCPIVEEGTALEGGEPIVQGWYRDEEVYYPDFGMNPPFAIPIWAFITGMDADGNPVFVEGQHNIIDAVPGDDGYSAFWRVNLVTVPDDYEPDSIRDAADINEMGYEVTETDLVVNCPVVMSMA